MITKKDEKPAVVVAPAPAPTPTGGAAKEGNTSGLLDEKMKQLEQQIKDMKTAKESAEQQLIAEKAAAKKLLEEEKLKTEKATVEAEKLKKEIVAATSAAAAAAASATKPTSTAAAAKTGGGAPTGMAPPGSGDFAVPDKAVQDANAAEQAVRNQKAELGA